MREQASTVRSSRFDQKAVFGVSTAVGDEGGFAPNLAGGTEDALDTIKFDRKTSSNGKFYFNLKASNGQIIGTSQMYESELSRDKGIESVIANVQNAEIQDQS